MDEQKAEENSQSRRMLLKAAVGTSVGVAAYTAPIIGIVPAYANHGWSATDVSGTQCIRFSPNHNLENGDWHIGNDGEHGNFNTHGEGVNAKLEIAGTAGGSAYTLEVHGNPDNDGVAAHGWGGGGVRLKLVTAGACRLLIYTIDCSYSCPNVGEGLAATWAVGSSDAPINSEPSGSSHGSDIPPNTDVYYHSGRNDVDIGSKNDEGYAERCKVSINYEVVCVP